MTVDRETGDAAERTRAVDGLVHMIFSRDPDTGLHLDAVGALSRRLAIHLGYDDEIVARVEAAARLHDVGKHCLDLAIIHKPMGLTSDEWTEIQKHPGHGARMVSGFASLRDLADIVRSHHERLDGKGYPDGLLGSSIPFESRIIAITDAFHAMTIPRPYTLPRAAADALLEIRRCAETQFDPRLRRRLRRFDGRFGCRAARFRCRRIALFGQTSGRRRTRMKPVAAHTESTIAAETAIVDGLLHLVRQRDPFTADHLEAVGILAGRIAQALELGPDAVARVRMAGRLHDIGMLSVPLQILEKHEPLAEPEMRKMRTHSDRGASSVGAFPQLQHYRSIVRAHHERIDGTGYPDGLIGLEIPYQARIISVADAFHAMTVPRDYAEIKAPAAAIAELYAGSGRQFDADYVAALARLMEHGTHALRFA